MTTQISNSSVVYPWPHLEPLPECGLAAKALWEMGVTALCFPGWAAAVLGLATEQLAIRPGSNLVFEQRGGSLRLHTGGGTPLRSYGLDYLTIQDLNRVAQVICELCGRPGAKNFDGGTSRALCDVDIHLRDSFRIVPGVQVSELSFSPRMPISDVAASALKTLRTRDPAVSVPAEGWSPAVLTTVTHLGGLGITEGVRFTIVGNSLHIEVDTQDDRVGRIAKSLIKQSEVTCRHCGRKVPDRSGVCAGCRWLQKRGWHAEPGGDADAAREDVVAFIQALPVGAVFTHATPGQQPDSWVKVADNAFRRTYGHRQFELWEFASWTHAELTEPVDGSIDQVEADRLAAEARRRAPRTEMGG